MIKIKAVYIDINPYFRHLGSSFGPATVKDGETKKMPNTLFGGASVNSARGYIYKIGYFGKIVKLHLHGLQGERIIIYRDDYFGITHGGHGDTEFTEKI